MNVIAITLLRAGSLQAAPAFEEALHNVRSAAAVRSHDMRKEEVPPMRSIQGRGAEKLMKLMTDAGAFIQEAGGGKSVSFTNISCRPGSCDMEDNFADKKPISIKGN